MSLPAIPSDLTLRQRRAVVALLTCTKPSTPTHDQAGVSRSTWTRWLAIPAFQQFLKDSVGQVFGASLLEAQLAHAEAIQKLRSLMQSKNEGIALNAAGQVAAYARVLMGQVDREKRLKAVEIALGLREGQNGTK